ncbi:MAG TPA: hypothetical protein VEF04_17355, partial [Blastocatellia bacterium]|nr:hypothetical protein [Blastocatellia bacterium]
MAERFVPIQLVLDTAQALSKARGFVSVLAGIGSGKVKNDFNQLASETQKTGAAFNDASAKAKTYRDSLGRLRDEFGRFASDGKRSFDQVERQAAKSAGGIKGAFNSVFGSVSSDASKFGSILKKAFSFTIAGIGIATLATATTAAFSSLISTGIKFNSTIETSQLGIASLIASVAQLNNSDGIQLKGIDKLNAAIPLAEEQIKKLRIAGLETAATTEQLVEAFQQAVGPGLAAGLGLDQVRQLTIDITQAAGALGVPMAQLSQEVRTILEGTIDQNARIAKALGLTNEMVRNWRAQGVLADQLNRKLEVFRASGERVSKTFAGATSNLEEAVQLLAGSATDKFFKEVTEDVIRFTARLIDLQNLDVSKELKPGVEAIDESL